MKITKKFAVLGIVGIVGVSAAVATPTLATQSMPVPMIWGSTSSMKEYREYLRQESGGDPICGIKLMSFNYDAYVQASGDTSCHKSKQTQPETPKPVTPVTPTPVKPTPETPVKDTQPAVEQTSATTTDTNTGDSKGGTPQELPKTGAGSGVAIAALLASGTAFAASAIRTLRGRIV